MELLPLSILSMRKWLPALLAVSSVAACSTGSSFTAGAPSAHKAQNYETTTSTATSTSRLGGAVIRKSFNLATGASTRGLATITGSLTHNTGRLELNDGLYLFIDPDGPDASNVIRTAANDNGNVGQRISGTYQYVIPYDLGYSIGRTSYGNQGVAGIITASTDMPSAGIAHYTGEAYMNMLPASLVGTGYNFESGTSNVDVDFAAGTANVALGSFAVSDGTNPVTAAAAPFDTVRGSGLAISGAQFSGGSWVTVKGGIAVNVTGSSTTATSNGTFFGYDPTISAPDELGGVVYIHGDTAFITGVFIAD